MPGFRRRMLWSPTPKRQAYAARWLPSLLREDVAAEQKIDHLLQSQPARWLNILAGMPSTRWLAILRPHHSVGQHICCGPTRSEVEDLGRVICELQDEDWLLHRHPGPLNYAGQDRLDQQSFALQRLLSRCVEQRQDARIVFAIHVAGDPTWHLHHSPDWPTAEVNRALERVIGLFGIYSNVELAGDQMC